MEPSTRPERTSRDEVGQVRVRARECCHPPGGGTPQDRSRDVLQDVHICTFGPFGPSRSVSTPRESGATPGPGRRCRFLRGTPLISSRASGCANASIARIVGWPTTRMAQGSSRCGSLAPPSVHKSADGDVGGPKGESVPEVADLPARTFLSAQGPARACELHHWLEDRAAGLWETVADEMPLGTCISRSSAPIGVPGSNGGAKVDHGSGGTTRSQVASESPSGTSGRGGRPG